jgi:hypothetical protein
MVKLGLSITDAEPVLENNSDIPDLEEDADGGEMEKVD